MSDLNSAVHDHAQASAKPSPATSHDGVAHFESLKLGRVAQALPDGLLAALRALYGDRLSLAQAVREHHGTDISSYPVTPPDAVVFRATPTRSSPSSRPARGHRVPMIPFGTGTSVEGHVLATHGGVCIDLSR